MWIHWWSPVTSANVLTSFWLTSCQSETPRSSPSACLSSSSPVMVRMAADHNRDPARGAAPGRGLGARGPPVCCVAMSPPPPLLLADAPHLLYRAFFALPDSIKDGDGRPVNALLGSVNQLLWCVDRYAPRAVVCCFGQESAHYRVEAYPSYHAHRPEMPDGLADQWERATD